MNGSEEGVLLWIRHAPHSTVHLGEAIRLATMGTALGVPFRLLFLGDGVRALLRGTEAYRLGPPIDKLLTDVVTAESPALVHRRSLEARGLSADDLAPRVPVELVDDGGAAEWLERSHRVVPF